ncbi:tetratricopeptide repeat protein [Maioricimonas rarisocia]|uniref:Tetratricopeptide repeat protein n=1 Tax=Maioricimonas rarisocia TaxID=2528026 RepID=A0A517Z2H4_9PLAN|nr:tetratricopeptide repeat protein [Maioricimonas rarisocia]QDU36672.1 tetratricopeptide repeat protein [Maioricimonas rarisocia]
MVASWWRNGALSRMMLALLILACGIGLRPAAAADQPPAPPTADPLDDASITGLPLQPADDPPTRFEPRQPRSDAERQRLSSLAWFMTGQLHQTRQEFDEAVAAFRKAVKVDPTSIDAYRSLIPLLYTRADDEAEREEARELALQAAGRADDGFDLVRGLAAVMARAGDVDEAATLLGKALEISDLEAGSLTELLLRRDIGLFYRLGGDGEKAAESYRLVFKALQATGDDALSEEDRTKLLGDPGTTFDEMGRVFLDAKLPDLAVKAFEEAARYRASRPAIHSYNLATVFRQTGQPEKALDELQKYFDAELQSKGRAAYQLLKELLEELDRSDELLPKLELLAERDPRNNPLQYFLADEYVASDKLEEAEELYSETLGGTQDPRGAVGLVAVYRRQARPEKLLEALTRAFTVVPMPEDEETLQRLNEDLRELSLRFADEVNALAEDKDVLDGLMELGRKLHSGDEPKLEFVQAYFLGKLAVQAERTEDVENFYRRAIDMRNDPPAVLFRELGEYLVDAKEYGKAARVYEEAANHTSDTLQELRWMFLYFQSFALEYDGATDAALAAINEARGLRPDNAALRFQAGWIHYHARQWDKAIEIFEDVIARASSPDEKELLRRAQFVLSSIYVQQDNMEKGEQILEDVLADEPDNVQANNDLGYLWADQGKNLEQARKMIEKAIAAEPDNPAYLDSMGWVLYQLGEFEEARSYLLQATEKDGGEDSTIFDHIGDCEQKLGNEEAARTAWEKAVELESEKASPDEELLEKIRSKLGRDDGEQKEDAAAEADDT